MRATPEDVLAGRARWAVVHARWEDAVASLPDGSVDVSINDPPYSEHTHAKVRRGGSVHAPDQKEGVKRPVISTSTVLGFDALSAKERRDAAAALARLTRRWVLAFSDAESVGRWSDDVVIAGMEHVRVGAWVKPGATPQFTGDRPASGFEAIEIAHPPGRKRWNGGGAHALWEYAPCTGPGRVHPTQKPLELMVELVRLFSEPDEVVLDMWAGSGTTGVACRMLGRRYIGIEMQAHHAKAAADRIAGGPTSLERGGQRPLFASPG